MTQAALSRKKPVFNPLQSANVEFGCKGRRLDLIAMEPSHQRRVSSGILSLDLTTIVIAAGLGLRLQHLRRADITWLTAQTSQ